MDMCGIVRDRLSASAGAGAGAPPRPEGPGRAPAGLRVVVFHQDELTRVWAEEVCARVESLLGPDTMRCTWWNCRRLEAGADQRLAAQAAAQADIVMISVDAAQNPIGALDTWVPAWRSLRLRQTGVLLALLSLSESSTHDAWRTRQYLAELARTIGLDFLPQERKTPECSPLPLPTARVSTDVAASTAGLI
jgi:hypothetical protein